MIISKISTSVLAPLASAAEVNASIHPEVSNASVLPVMNWRPTDDPAKVLSLQIRNRPRESQQEILIDV